MEPPGADVVLVRHGDIGVKSSRVQNWMERRLRENVAAMLEARSIGGSVERDWGRLFVRTSDPSAAANAVGDVFGVVSASPAVTVPPDLDAIAESLAATARRHYEAGTFAVDARRTGEHAFTSQEVGQVGGDAVWTAVEDEFEPAVDLDDPDVRFGVEVREERAFVFVARVEGPGGLPVGTQDPLVALISGGIDSPVAAWLAMKRGAPIVPLYLDLGDYGGADHRARALETIETLSRYAPQENWNVRVGEAGPSLDRLAERIGDTRMLSVRRFMYLVAERVAEATGAEGIVTGEAIGQKSSQTVANLAVTDRVTRLPVHRPLLSMDKQEIIARAREIGTYETATIDAGCNRIAPSQPATRASIETVTGAEPDAMTDWAAEVAAGVESVPLEALAPTPDGE
jgi:thiamine biosynthesis protein ThiI